MLCTIINKYKQQTEKQSNEKAHTERMKQTNGQNNSGVLIFGSRLITYWIEAQTYWYDDAVDLLEDTETVGPLSLSLPVGLIYLTWLYVSRNDHSVLEQSVQRLTE